MVASLFLACRDASVLTRRGIIADDTLILNYSIQSPLLIKDTSQDLGLLRCSNVLSLGIVRGCKNVAAVVGDGLSMAKAWLPSLSSVAVCSECTYGILKVHTFLLQIL